MDGEMTTDRIARATSAFRSFQQGDGFAKVLTHKSEQTYVTCADGYTKIHSGAKARTAAASAPPPLRRERGLA
jgi:hypothetical protein